MEEKEINVDSLNGSERQVKQVIVMRKDLGMRKGKMVSQGSHASLGALLQCFHKEPIFANEEELSEHEKEQLKGNPLMLGTRYSVEFENHSYLDKWLNGIFTKICLGVNSEEELVSLYERIKKENPNIPCVMIEDSGLTEFHGVKTKTCIGIGPFWSDEIDVFTNYLKLL